MATETGTSVGRAGQGPWAGGDRLPVAPRQRRPALAALAVLLILGGGLISAVLVLRSGQKEAVIVLKTDVAAGHVLERGDLVSAQVATGGVPSVPWSQLPEVVGSTAGADLRRGTLLNPRVVSKKRLPGPGQLSVGLALKPDQLPAEGLQAGDHVRVLYAPAGNAAPNSAASSFTPPPDGVLVKNAVVFNRSQQRSDGTVTLTLVVSESQALRLAQLGRLQAIALSTLPKGG